MMDSSPLMQMFIISALDKYADLCIKDEAHLLKSMENGIVSGEAWVQAAKELRTAIDTRMDSLGLGKSKE